MRTRSNYARSNFNIYCDTQDPEDEGWAYNFVGTTHEGDHVTASGSIENTQDLLKVLIAYAPDDYDLSELPVWGPAPADTTDVYSWDATHKIVGCSMQGLTRRARLTGRS